MRLAALLLLVTTLAACPRSTPPHDRSHYQPLGEISEAEFKAMHQLRTDAPPPLNGWEITVGGARSYFVRAETVPSGLPGVVLIHEWWGLNDHIKHWADRIAGLGYAVLAVDLYGGQLATTPDEAMALMQQVDDAAADQVIAAAIDHLRTERFIESEQVAVMGWCFGGAWAMEAALDHPDLAAAVMYYGMPEIDVERLKTLEPALLGIFAERDGHITPEVVDQLEASLAEAGKTAELHRYDAEHAFANPSNPVYDEVNAAAAWEVVVAFLARELR